MKMMIDEAEQIVGRELTEDEWDLINHVYMHHPSIDTKNQLGVLFNIGGWVLLEDMERRASHIKKLECDLHKAQFVRDNIEQVLLRAKQAGRSD